MAFCVGLVSVKRIPMPMRGRSISTHLPVGFEDAVVAGDFDDHGGPVGKRIGEINVATCHAEVGDSRFEFGTGSDVNDSGFGGERIAQIATPFAATGGWRFLPPSDPFNGLDRIDVQGPVQRMGAASDSHSRNQVG